MTCREAASAELQHSLLQEVLMALQKLDLTTSGVGMLLRTQTAPRKVWAAQPAMQGRGRKAALRAQLVNQLSQSMPLMLGSYMNASSSTLQPAPCQSHPCCSKSVPDDQS